MSATEQTVAARRSRWEIENMCARCSRQRRKRERWKCTWSDGSPDEVVAAHCQSCVMAAPDVLEVLPREWRKR